MEMNESPRPLWDAACQPQTRMVTAGSDDASLPGVSVVLVDEVRERIREAEGLYYRLVLVVGPSGVGKTRLLQEVRKTTGAPLLNVNLELSRRLLSLDSQQRRLSLPALLSDLVSSLQSSTVLLDNTELIFDPVFAQDPLRLLQQLSRSKTVVAAWNGTVSGHALVYAAPEHPEYRCYPIHDFLTVSLGQERIS